MNLEHNLEHEDLKRLYANTPYGVLAVDWQGNIVFVNHEAKKLLKLNFCNNYYRCKSTPAALPLVLKNMVDKTIEQGCEISEQPLLYLPAGKTFVEDKNLKAYNQEYIDYCGYSFFLTGDDGQPSLTMPTVLLTLMPKVVDGNFDAVGQTVVAQLAAGLANQALNPLTAVKGFMQLLCEQEENRGGNTAYLHQALDELDTANTHLRDFIMCLQPTVPQVEIVEGETLIIKAVGKMLDYAAQHQISIEIERPTPPVLLKCDPQQIIKAMTHVISNAIDYSRSGDKITIGIVFDYDSGNARIFIRDQGNGIPARMMDKIFDPYYSTSCSKVGLGLPIARALLDNNSASIIAFSAVKMGTEIWLLIPGIVSNNPQLDYRQLALQP